MSASPSSPKHAPKPSSFMAWRAALERPRRHWTPHFILCLSLLLTAAVTIYVDLTAEVVDRQHFDNAVAQAKDTFESRFKTYIALLRATSGLFAAKKRVTRDDFHDFITPLELSVNYPEVLGFGVTHPVAPASEDEAEHAISNEHGRAITIWPRTGQESFPVVYLEPESPRNQAALGYDMGSEPTRRAAMDRARDTGEPTATGRLTLAQEIKEPTQPGFIIYVPIYDGPTPPTVEGRHKALRGFVYGAFRANDLFNNLMKEVQRAGLEVSVSIGSPREGATSLYHSGVAPPAHTLGSFARFSHVLDLDLAGQTWILAFGNRASIEQGSSKTFTPLIAAGGLLVSFVLFLASREQAMARNEAERLFREADEARRSAEEASRAKDEFLATLSHELRTPLTAMMGWIRMLRGGKLGADATARGLEVIERNVLLQRQLIEDLLDVSRIITGKLRLSLRPTNLESVVEASVDSMRPAAEAKGVTLAVTGEPRGIQIAADSDRVQQVLWNLLSNAIRFTSRGGRVEVHVAKASSMVDISVRDTGKGISPAFLPYVFDRFRQADGSTTRAHGGMGLGLSIVRHLVELHGGAVSASSEGEGKGAVFNVSLPRIQTLPAVEMGEVSPKIAEPSSAPPEALRGLRVLVVDDEPDARELLQMVLGQCGAGVITAASASEALEALSHERPDVLISDIGMPREDGYSLIQKVRAREREAGGAVPAVALTAYARDEDRRRALSAGFQMHVPKPIEPARLVAVVASLVGRLGGEPPGLSPSVPG